MQRSLRRTAVRLALTLAALGIARGAGADPAIQRRLAREAPADVAAAWRRALDAGPYDASLWVGLAEVERFRCDLSASRAALARVLARDPLDARARAGLAEALLLDARGAEALAEADRGLALPAGRVVAELWRVRGLALVELRRYAEAREAAGRAASLAPSDARAWEALARAAFHECDMAASRTAYARAVELEPFAEEANQRLGNGFGAEIAERPWERDASGAEFQRALAQWQAGGLEEARDGFGALARAHPEVFKYRLGLGSVLAERRRLHEAWGGGRARDVFALLPAPEVPELVRVMPDYPRLPARERHVVRVVTAPLKPWWPALIRAGATHDLMTVPENLGDRETRAGLRGRLTFDGRCYDHVRGVGGLSAATGVEKLDEGADLAFQTLAHELAHQVLSYALPAELAARVKVLYAAAAAEGRFLDYYAASNVDEYFAQGYEALVSHVKRGCLKETQRHTRAELRTRDPALFAFLMETFDLAHETPESMAGFRAALAAEAATAVPPAPPAAPR
jgi:tetratricopeptide (TPR) repeat protein